jgi:hypothetical protein
MAGKENDTQSSGAHEVEPDQEILNTEFQKDTGGSEETK